MYDKEAKLWTSQRVSIRNIIIQDANKILTKNDFSRIDFVFENIEKLNDKGKQAINSFALKYKQSDILLSRKYLLSIHFDVNKGLEQYYFLYEIAKDSSKDWKVLFERNEVLDIQRTSR